VTVWRRRWGGFHDTRLAWYTSTDAPVAPEATMALPHESIDEESEAPNVIFLDDNAEAHAYFDKMARDLVGMSGEEFLRRLDSGEWEEVIDDGEHADHLFLAMMRSFGE
jgi:hypothetical protein